MGGGRRLGSASGHGALMEGDPVAVTNESKV